MKARVTLIEYLIEIKMKSGKLTRFLLCWNESRLIFVRLNIGVENLWRKNFRNFISNPFVLLNDKSEI